jgi:hypothetical protein
VDDARDARARRQAHRSTNRPADGALKFQ